ncbi:MAG TPA: radical SAM protein [Syntrophobacteria bacterium]|nr:radical SAM protein [Syntrophobacteria bacterium]
MERHVFGPVCSRRLGRSLGIDLLPFKTCTYSCIYCECGPTTNLTTERREFFPTPEVIEELDDVLARRPELDYITFAGSGEPTLSLSLGLVITHLKTCYPGYRVAVLTNGSLFQLPEVRKEVVKADLVIPTLTTARQETFERIHRPAPRLSVDAIIRGLIELRKEFFGEIWLEVFIVPLLNTTKDELDSLRDAIARIRPDRVQLNTIDRPPAEAWVEAAVTDELEHIRDVLGDAIPVDIIGLPQTRAALPKFQAGILERIEQTLLRRPCTAEDIARMTGLHIDEVTKYLAELSLQGKVHIGRGKRGIFYQRIHGETVTDRDATP